MAPIFLFFALLAAPASDNAPVANRHSEYRARRAKLRKELPQGVTVIFGRTEKENDDLRSGFFQEPNFYYLTGWMEPGAVLMMTPDEEFFFLPKRVPEEEKWTGRKVGPDDGNASAVTGFDTVLAAESFESQFRRLLENYPRIYTLTERPQAKALETLAPLRPVMSAARAIARLRMDKSPAELALIQKSTDVSVEAHRAAWRTATPGAYEYQVAAAMTDVYFAHGCERSAYAPIVGSGPNAAILHYSRNSRRMDRGELLLMDVGAECSAYTTDITRTIPIGGKFTKRQREIYEIVLGAQNAAIAAIKPGMTLPKASPNSLYKIAYDYIDSHGKDLRGNSLGKYFTHGLGHHVGLEVHDASDLTAPLRAGMVITIEPGIYIPEENIGVRIEDTILVTENGSKVLSGALPRDPSAIERALAESPAK